MNCVKSISTIFTILLLSSCSTSLTIKSNPTGANVVSKDSGISTITDGKVNIPNELFDTGDDEYIYYSKKNKEWKVVNFNPKTGFTVEGIRAKRIDFVVDAHLLSHKRIRNNKNQRDEILVFEKEGYRTLEEIVTLEKGEDNSINVELDEINTYLNISSTPAPTHLHFVNKDYPNPRSDNYNIKDVLPLDWPESFTTPINLSCTEKEVKKLKGLKLTKVFGDGYIPTGTYRSLNQARGGYKLSLEAKKENNLNISLKPVITTLQVISTPPGAVVEDISSGGFGYLGETPLIRNFNWEDVVEWSERRDYKSSEEEANAYQNNDRTGSKKKWLNSGTKETLLYNSNNNNFKITTIKRDQKFADNRRTSLEKALIYLDLRITKPGYEDAYLKRLRLPVGEERSFQKNLHREITNITFATDPKGVHVYVTRSTNKDIYNPETGTVSNKTISYQKHLGTTPFTLNMDPSDPLVHGDKFILMKTGYITINNLEYAYGNKNYYMVMEPKNVRKR